jgi:hypothetical protein
LPHRLGRKPEPGERKEELDNRGEDTSDENEYSRLSNVLPGEEGNE